MAASLQHQARPTVPLIPSTVPPQIAGMAWHRPFEPPFFSTALKPHQYPQEAVTLTPSTLPPKVSGMAWYVPVEQPRFFSVPPEKHTNPPPPVPLAFPISYAWNTQEPDCSPWPPYRRDLAPQPALVLTPATLPPKIAGMAWWTAFEQPQITTTVRLDKHTTSVGAPQSFPLAPFWIPPLEQPRFSTTVTQEKHTPFLGVLTPATLPPQIAGMAWHKPWEPPLFLASVKVQLQATEFHTEFPPLPPTSIAGMGWCTAFDQPRFSTAVKTELQPAFFESLSPATLPPQISGMAWYVPFKELLTAPPPRTQGEGFGFAAPVPISTIAGMAWWRPFDTPIQTLAIRATDAVLSQPTVTYSIAWYRSFDTPSVSARVPFADAAQAVWTALAPAMGWWRPFDQPTLRAQPQPPAAGGVSIVPPPPTPTPSILGWLTPFAQPAFRGYSAWQQPQAYWAPHAIIGGGIDQFDISGTFRLGYALKGTLQISNPVSGTFQLGYGLKGALQISNPVSGTFQSTYTVKGSVRDA